MATPRGACARPLPSGAVTDTCDPGDPVRIDVHAHFLPDSAVRAHERGTDWYGSAISRDDHGVLVAETAGKSFRFGSPTHFEPKEERVRRMDDRGVDLEVLSMLPP